MSTDFDVVIVGGGAAGIGAARRLAASGLSALVLEATARIGGRAWTYEISGLPLDLGCGWLHSADRNVWTGIAEAAGVKIDRRPSAWGDQYRDLGFTAAEQAAAAEAFGAWMQRMATAPPASDRASDALPPDDAWNAFVEALSGFIGGAGLERLSAADYMAYAGSATELNWRVPNGYGALIAASMPASVALRCATPVDAITLEAHGVTVATRAGSIRARTAILTVSTAVLAQGAMRLPSALDPWRAAASVLPLGRNEKLFLEISGDSDFAPETHVLGNPRDPRTGSYYIRPFGLSVIECFAGGDGARVVEESGPVAGFAFAIDQLVDLFGSAVRKQLRPLIASNWSRMTYVGGSYSAALPGHAAAREVLSRPFEQRIFFAGEATNLSDFSTAHGAHDSGVRAAEEAIAALVPDAVGPTSAASHILAS
jgi:monoamine oxidase